MQSEIDQEESMSLNGGLWTAVELLVAISPCPFARGRLLYAEGHITNRSPDCPARGARRRKPRPFINEMRGFVEERKRATPTRSWESLMREWNPGHEMHSYASAGSMREAYKNAIRRRGDDPVPTTCRTCVLDELRRRDRARSQSA